MKANVIHIIDRFPVPVRHFKRTHFSKLFKKGGTYGYIVRDAVDEELTSMNIDLQTPLRDNMLDTRHPYFLKKFKRKRRPIETVIGQPEARFFNRKFGLTSNE